MTLEEAIRHAEEKAKCGGECGEDHAQLAVWLKELQMLQSVQPKIEERKEESAQNVPKEDLISRKAAIDAAVKMFEAWYGGSVLRDREIRAMFEALPAAEPEPKWTRYKKKVPPEGMYVLVSRGSVFWLDCIMGDRGTPYWRIAGDVEIDWDVWMFLPKPYGGEQDG